MRASRTLQLGLNNACSRLSGMLKGRRIIGDARPSERHREKTLDTISVRVFQLHQALGYAFLRRKTLDAPVCNVFRSGSSAQLALQLVQRSMIGISLSSFPPAG